jgi:hypothetical protein
MVKAVGAIELIAGVGGEVEDTVGQGDPHPPSPLLPREKGEIGLKPLSLGERGLG